MDKAQLLDLNRIIQFSIRTEECLSECDELIIAIDNSNGIIRKGLEQGFRMYMVQFRQLLSDYMAHCLKSMSFSVSDTSVTFLEIVKKCEEQGFLKELDENFIKVMTKYRNLASHGYKIPKIQELISFYKDNRAEFNKVKNSMIETANRLKTKS